MILWNIVKSTTCSKSCWPGSCQHQATKADLSLGSSCPTSRCPPKCNSGEWKLRTPWDRQDFSAMASCDIYWIYCHWVIDLFKLFTWALVSTKRRSRSRMPPTWQVTSMEKGTFLGLQNSVVLRRQACHVTFLWKVEFDISSQTQQTPLELRLVILRSSHQKQRKHFHGPNSKGVLKAQTPPSCAWRKWCRKYLHLGSQGILNVLFLLHFLSIVDVSILIHVEDVNVMNNVKRNIL